MRSDHFPKENELQETPYRLSEAEERLYSILVPKNEAEAIDILSFVDLYGKERVDADAAKLAAIESKIREEAELNPESKKKTRRGKLFEAIVNNGIENNDWLGENASVIVPSRYDDVLNGVDSIVEFDKKTAKSHLALAIDATKSEKDLGEKFAAIAGSAMSGRLSVVKYFRSETVRGELRGVPRVIVGVDVETSNDAVDLLLRLKKTQEHIASERQAKNVPSAEDVARLRELREKIANHPFQFKMLQEIYAQLGAFIDYYDHYFSISNPPPVKKTCEDLLATIKEIILEKVSKEEQEKMFDDFMRSDVMFSAIIKQAEILQNR